MTKIIILTEDGKGIIEEGRKFIFSILCPSQQGAKMYMGNNLNNTNYYLKL